MGSALYKPQHRSVLVVDLTVCSHCRHVRKFGCIDDGITVGVVERALPVQLSALLPVVVQSHVIVPVGFVESIEGGGGMVEEELKM